MNIEIIITAIISALIGIFVTYIYVYNRAKKKIIGTLIIDPVNPEINGGVYTVWDVDPLKLEPGQIICLDVARLNITATDSQQNQGA